MSKRFPTVLATSFVLFALTACAPKPAATDPAADDAKMRADALVWFEHFAKADADGMANLYADDALLMPPGAPAVMGRPGIRAFLGDEATKAKAAGISLKNKAVTGSGVSGDLGWISGTYDVVDAAGTVIDSGSYLSVHKRQNGSWPYIRDTWNSDRPPAPAAPAAQPPANP
jgi:ketosteroid isomerase-like protein